MTAAAANDLDAFFDKILYFADPDAGFSKPGPIARWQSSWELAVVHALEQSDPLAVLATRQGFVVSTAQAERYGVTRAQRRTRIANGQWAAPHPGFVAPLDLTSDPRPLRARRMDALAASSAALGNLGQVICGRSAAAVHGLPTFGRPDQPLLTTHPLTTLGRRSAVHARGAHLPLPELMGWFGVRITTVERTIVDLARHDRWDAIMAVDAAMREKLVTLAGLDRALSTAVGWPGVRQAREVLALARPESESPFESLLRLRLHDDGFPPPELQVEIAIPGWDVPYRVDMLWPRHRLILEADGLAKYSAAELRREKRRDVALGRLGYRVIRVIWDDVVTDWLRTSAYLRSLLRYSPFGLPPHGG